MSDRRKCSHSSSSSSDSSDYDKRKKRKHSRSSSTSSDSSDNDKRKKRKHKHSSSTSSDSSDYDRKKKKLKKMKKKAKKKLKKEIKKRLKMEYKLEKKRIKMEKQRQKKERKASEVQTVSQMDIPSHEESPDIGPSIEELAVSKARAPMTKEEWEKQRSVIRRVYDEESGRNRLIKGDGEVMEECVSRDRHLAICKQATAGDGRFFQAALSSKLHQS